MLNLNETADLHYRYKMPRVETRVESRGNGIKTAVLNLSKVAESLCRPPNYILKYFSYELGCVSDETENRHIINGSHTSEKIQGLVYNFIKKFVLCSSCNNPETNIMIESISLKKSAAKLVCLACGIASPIDSSHKLTSFIIKNPPPERYQQLMTNAVKKNSNENAESDKLPSPLVSNLSKDEKKIEEDLKNLLINNNALTLDQKLDNFDDFLKKNFLNILNSKTDRLMPQQLKDIFNQAIAYDIKPYASLILAKLMFPILNIQSKDITSCITNNWHSILNIFLTEYTPSQLNFLVGLEDVFCFKSSKNDSNEVRYLIKGVQKLFLWLYNQSLIDSESFIQWFQRLENSICPDNLDQNYYSQLIDCSRPFIDWLQDDQSDSEEENLEQQNNDTSGKSFNQNQEKYISTNNMAAKLAQNNHNSNVGSGALINDEEEDIDIDDI